jgi:hypothetical protein
MCILYMCSTYIPKTSHPERFEDITGLTCLVLAKMAARRDTIVHTIVRTIDIFHMNTERSREYQNTKGGG